VKRVAGDSGLFGMLRFDRRNRHFAGFLAGGFAESKRHITIHYGTRETTKETTRKSA